MTNKHLKYSLNRRDREKFKKDGFILIKDVLSKREVKNLLSTVDAIWEKHHSKNQEHYLHMFDFFNQGKTFTNLISHKKTLPLVLGLLGWNIYMYHAHLDVNLPISKDSSPDLTWHRDNSRINYDFVDGKYPLLALKVGYWLSDVSTKGRGNLYVIPGSHKWNHKLGKTIKNDKLPSKAIPIKAKPGDIILFDSRIWHTRSNNFSKFIRKVIFIGYTYRWIRPRDDAIVSPDILFKATEFQKQLLSRDINSSSYTPKEEDVPLKKLYCKLYEDKN